MSLGQVCCPFALAPCSKTDSCHLDWPPFPPPCKAHANVKSKSNQQKGKSMIDPTKHVSNKSPNKSLTHMYSFKC